MENQSDPKDIYAKRFLNSPVNVMVLSKSIKIAESSYNISKILSIILFFTNLVLIIVAVIIGLTTQKEILPLIFGSLGTANLIALLLYRPIEKIQTGVNELIKSQIACLSYQAQFDSTYRTLATWSELPLKDVDLDKQKEFSLFLREAGTQLINDLDHYQNTKYKM